MLNLNHYPQACRHRCISGHCFSPSKSNVSYFLGGEKRQPEIRLCLQAVSNTNHDINKSVGLTQTGQTLGRAKPPVFLFPVLLHCISFFPMQSRPYHPPRGTRGFTVLWYRAFFKYILVSSRPAVCGFSSFWLVMVIGKRTCFTLLQYCSCALSCLMQVNIFKTLDLMVNDYKISDS